MGGALQSFTEEDLLQAIKAAFEAATSSPPKKRRSNPDNQDTVQQHHSKTAQFSQTHSLSHIVLKVMDPSRSSTRGRGGDMPEEEFYPEDVVSSRDSQGKGKALAESSSATGTRGGYWKRQWTHQQAPDRVAAAPVMVAPIRHVAHLRCFNCNEVGHTFRFCTRPKSQSCYSCGQTGHIARECTQPQGNQPRQQPQGQARVFAIGQQSTGVEANTSMRYPTMTFEGQITYSRTAVEVEKAAMEVLNTLEAKKNEMGQNTVGFDIEWKPTFRRGVPPGKVAVLQICGDTSCHVMHIIHSGIPRSLQLLLESSSILKVGVGIANDAVKFLKDYNVSIKAVEDLSRLANQKLSGDSKNWGLASLTKKLICKQLLKPKKIQLSNWETNYLSQEQLQYAATDAFASWHLYEVLRSLPDIEKLEKVTADNQSEEQAVSCNYFQTTEPQAASL